MRLVSFPARRDADRMHGLMQERSLALPLVFRRVERYFGHKRVVSGHAVGETVAAWSEVCERTRRLAAVLDRLEVPHQARVGTFGWNSQRHVELYLAVPCSGRILHTINHRLFGEQIGYIVEDAADDVIFIDRSLLAVVWPVVSASARHAVRGGHGRWCRCAAAGRSADSGLRDPHRRGRARRSRVRRAR
ncbi:AMP-binding protein [Actinomadura madurae]|uniref:AMP-binding protein n=1 Tax=Actinomadura madurae TaxID=1993 RepID=UPI0035572F26